MNFLKRDKQIAVLSALVEGNSIRSCERMFGVHRDTIMRLGVRAGEGCARLMDERMRGLTCRRIQVDELWGFVGKKQRHLTAADDPSRCGDIWTWVAIDRDTKAIPSYRVGKRDGYNAVEFMFDLKRRIVNRPQISSDALSTYVDAVEMAFGSDVDYGQIVKFYEAEPMGPGRYSPPHVTAVERAPIAGAPDVNEISTSHVERMNLTLRMTMRRLTRLTNGFSKKPENFKAAMALSLAHYNFCRVHSTLRVTPAMEAGITNHVWTIANLTDIAL